MIGTTISHYKILEKLGEGGMGVVYKAQDLNLDRLVALKFLPPHVSSSVEDKARFVQEAKAAAALSHPNICTIFGVEEHDGQTFIAMEFVEGKTLTEVKTNMPVKQALDIGIQLADGLAAAHEKGIVHRDVKPENIMLRKDGRIQIMDFGLAKLKGVSRLTKEGTTFGTAGYMSPEQVQGHDTDHRSDIFSLGVILYELLSGQSPFKGVHETAITYEIVNVEALPMSSIKTSIGPLLDAIVLECLEKDPNERTQSAKQVALDLKRFKRETSKARMSRTFSVPQPGVSPDRLARQRFPLLIAGGIFFLALFLGIGAGWVLLSRPSPAPANVTKFVLRLEGKGFSDEDGFNEFLLSPDGSRLAYIAGRGQNEQLYVREMNELEVRALPNTKGTNIRKPFFSPDSRWIGFFSRGKLMKLSLGGGTPIAICDAAGDLNGSWSEDGAIVFMQEWGSHLWVVSADAGSTPRPLTKLRLDEGERGHILPRVLPGGKSALFTIWTGKSFEEALIGIVDIASGKHEVLLRGGSDARFVKSGHLVYARGATVMAAPFDLPNLKLSGELVPVVDNVRLDGGGGYSSFSVSENGAMVFAAGGVEYDPTVITLVDRSGKSKLISPKEKTFGEPLFSPDGTKLGVTIYGPTFHIGVYDLQRGILTPLTFSADNWRAAWYRDGSRLSFTSNSEGKYQVYSVAADGGGSPEKLFEQEGNPYPGSWSHDGKLLAYVVTGNKTLWDIWIFSKDGEPRLHPVVQTPANEFGPNISPDGKWLTYVSDESGENEVYVRSFPSGAGKWRISSGGGTSPIWSPDGRRIYYRRIDEIFSVLLTIKTGQDGGTITVHREEPVLKQEGLNSFSISPDGKTIVFDRRDVGTLPKSLNVVINWFAELTAKVPIK